MFRHYANDFIFITATLTTTASAQSTAINKETASWRTYQQQRTLDQLRRSAHRLLHNDVISDVIARIEQLVDDGGLQVISYFIMFCCCCSFSRLLKPVTEDK